MTGMLAAIKRDHALVSHDLDHKVSNTTLKYMRDMKVITTFQAQVYRRAVEDPTERFLPSERAVVKYINNRFLHHCEKLDMLFLTP